MSTSLSPLLSKSQIAALAEIGEKRSAAVGDLLYRVGDRPHSLMVGETDVAGVFAAGDVRSASTKRCATAAGEGTMAVQFVHAHLNTAVKEGAR